jgi:hypothetical protein
MASIHPARAHPDLKGPAKRTGKHNACVVGGSPAAGIPAIISLYLTMSSGSKWPFRFARVALTSLWGD